MLWVDCSSEATARTDFKIIGNLSRWAVDESDSLCGAKDQLASHDKSSLLLLDNCDDTKTNFSCYIPNSSRVSVVLTTRLSDTDKYASLDTQDSKSKLFLRMDGLDPASATRLVLGASGTQEPSSETIRHAHQITDALDYHPLAIVAACSLLKSNVYSIKKYAEALKDPLTQKELLDTETEQATYRKISTTFEISATVLKESAVSDESAQHALDLLNLLAFMHHRNISEDIFIRAWKYEEEILTGCTNQDREPQDLSMWHVAQARKYLPYATIGVRTRMLRKARAHLIRLSLVKPHSEDNSIYMHSLVHLWARERLHHAFGPWIAAASTLALAAQGSHSWQPYSPQLALHFGTNLRLRRFTGGTGLHSEAICRIWSNFAGHMLDTYHPQSADVLELFSREVQSQSCLEAHDPLSTEPQLMLAVIYLRNGNSSQAVSVLEDVVRIRARLDEDRQSRQASQHALARAHLEEWRNSEAVEIFEHLVNVTKKELVADLPLRLTYQQGLAFAYLRDGRISQAIEILEHVAHIGEKLLADHPSRLASQRVLAHAYLQDGRIFQAIVIFEHLVQMRGKLAATDPRRLTSQHELARAYWHSKRFAEADELMSYVVDVQQRTLPESHPDRTVSERVLAKIREDPKNPAAVSKHCTASDDQQLVDAPQGGESGII